MSEQVYNPIIMSQEDFKVHKKLGFLDFYNIQPFGKDSVFTGMYAMYRGNMSNGKCATFSTKGFEDEVLKAKNCINKYVRSPYIISSVTRDYPMVVLLEYYEMLPLDCEYIEKPGLNYKKDWVVVEKMRVNVRTSNYQPCRKIINGREKLELPEEYRGKQVNYVYRKDNVVFPDVDFAKDFFIEMSLLRHLNNVSLRIKFK